METIRILEPMIVNSKEEFVKQCTGFCDFPEQRIVNHIFGAWETDGDSVTEFIDGAGSYIAVLSYWYLNREITLQYIIFNQQSDYDATDTKHV